MKLGNILHGSIFFRLQPNIRTGDIAHHELRSGLFGGTGDLAWRKLLPALFQAFRHGSLPEGGRIIGVARDDLSDEAYRELISNRFDAVIQEKRPTAEEFERFAARCCSTSAWISPSPRTTPGWPGACTSAMPTRW